jgi:hypothetical protein
LEVGLLEKDRNPGVGIYGTGVNPGFTMNALALMLTAPCAEVTAVHVVRMQDASLRRLPFQQKIGVGATREEFQHRVASGSIGHVGFRESTLMIAGAIGWSLDEYREFIERVMGPMGRFLFFSTVNAKCSTNPRNSGGLSKISSPTISP